MSEPHRGDSVVVRDAFGQLLLKEATSPVVMDGAVSFPLIYVAWPGDVDDPGMPWPLEDVWLLGDAPEGEVLDANAYRERMGLDPRETANSQAGPE